MHDTSAILLQLFIVFVAARSARGWHNACAPTRCRRRDRRRLPRQPLLLGWVHGSEALDVLAEIGVVLLLFSVGWNTPGRPQTRVSRALAIPGRRSGRRSGCPSPWARCGRTAPATTGTSRLFLAAAFDRHLGRHHRARTAGPGRPAAREPGDLGAAVIGDILAMLLLGVVTALTGGSLHLGSLARGYCWRPLASSP